MNRLIIRFKGGLHILVAKQMQRPSINASFPVGDIKEKQIREVFSPARQPLLRLGPNHSVVLWRRWRGGSHLMLGLGFLSPRFKQEIP
jgi:hypothetical protein